MVTSAAGWVATWIHRRRDVWPEPGAVYHDHGREGRERSDGERQRRRLDVAGPLTSAVGQQVEVVYDRDNPAKVEDARYRHRELLRMLGFAAGWWLIAPWVLEAAMPLAARVLAQAGPGEIWCSRTVKDLVAGAGFGVADRGIHTLKGVPDQWGPYVVERTGP
jgi:hypothetical protein